MRKVFFVVGPGRSGTSTITKALTTFGVDLGDNLMAPEKCVNEKGFFEDLDVHSLNTRLFEANGLNWHTLSLESPKDVDGSSFSREAEELLELKLQRSPLIGIKDPQITRLLPFWRNAVSRVGAQDYHVIATRSPTSVATSLAEHSGLGLARCYELWFVFTLASLMESHAERRIVVSYEQMIDDPLAELRRISSKFNLELDAQSDVVSDFAGSFVDKNLQHNRATSKAEIGELVIKIEALHDLMQRLATDKSDPADPKIIQEIEYFHDIHRRENGASALVREQEAKIEELQKVVEDLRDSIVSVVEDRDSIRAHIEAINRNVVERDTTVKLLQDTVESLMVDRDAYKYALQRELAQSQGLLYRVARRLSKRTGS